jgi:hypothetical protein
MTRIRLTLCSIALVAALSALLATGASAATFFVNERGASSNCSGKGSLACATIKEAITQAEKSPPPNKIEVEPEEGLGATYKETIALVNPKASGLTIEGSEPGVTVVSNLGPTVTASMTGNVTLANFTLITRTPSVLKSAIAARHLALTLDNMKVMNEDSGGTDGIEALEGASVTMNGGSIEMESTEGFGAFAVESPLSLNGVTILGGAAAPDESGGVFSEKSALAVSNSTVSLASGTPGKEGIRTNKDSSVTITDDTIKQGDSANEARGMLIEGSPVSVNGLTVDMENSTSQALAVGVEQTGATSSNFSRLQVEGTWRGPGVLLIGGTGTTVSDSHIETNPAFLQAPLLYGSTLEGPGLLLQRTVLKAPAVVEDALFVENANLTLDSSEVLGGLSAIKLRRLEAGTSTLTVSASTIDANVPGTASDAPGVNGVVAQASTEPGVTVNVNIRGSIVLEKQVALQESADTASVACGYSAVPSQAQASGGGSGAIACASGAGGNSEANPTGSLFAEPLTNYQLLPGSAAIDSVPAGAITLPFGITPSATDLAGNPRVVDGNGDCLAVQDKGALELQGHSAPCPVPLLLHTAPHVATKPAITALAIAPGAFRAAPRGATLAKVKYGAKLSWRDSQAATSTFTVVRLESGRRQGRSCKLPSHKNRHGRRCTLKVKAGTFTHADGAGAESARFSGRVKGHRLRAGAYQLVVVPRNANGTGAAVSRSFKVI